MAVGNVEFMHECCLQHLHMGNCKNEIKYKKQNKKATKKSEHGRNKSRYNKVTPTN